MNAPRDPAGTGHAAYIRRETGVSMVINSFLSALFFWLVFRRLDPVPVWGAGKWVFDFAPQSFMIALMSVLVPGALTRRKIATGQIVPSGQRARRPLIVRALTAACLCAMLGAAFVALVVLITGIAVLPWRTALLVKVGYGAALAAIVTPIGLRATLAGA